MDTTINNYVNVNLVVYTLFTSIMSITTIIKKYLIVILQKVSTRKKWEFKFVYIKVNTQMQH